MDIPYFIGVISLGALLYVENGDQYRGRDVGAEKGTVFFFFK